MQLAAEHYNAGDAFQREKLALFASNWLPIGAVAQLAGAGDFVAASIGGWPLLAVRGDDGELRAFHNSCRHKKMLVVEQAGGHCASLRCRYHGWTYRLDGHFLQAPPPVAPKEPSSPDNHLMAAGSECSRGIVFVHLDANAAPGDFSALPSLPERHQHVVSLSTDIDCNWKTLLEHALADRTRAWQWPLVLARSDTDALVIEQITPRTFLRTRLTSHVFARNDTMLVKAGEHADTLRAACETLQQARNAGRLAETSDARIAELHRRVLAAYA